MTFINRKTLCCIIILFLLIPNSGFPVQNTEESKSLEAQVRCKTEPQPPHQGLIRSWIKRISAALAPIVSAPAPVSAPVSAPNFASPSSTPSLNTKESIVHKIQVGMFNAIETTSMNEMMGDLSRGNEPSKAPPQQKSAMENMARGMLDEMADVDAPIDDWQSHIQPITYRSAEEVNEELSQTATKALPSVASSMGMSMPSMTETLQPMINMTSLYKPPYETGTQVLFFKTLEPTQWVRVHTDRNPIGRWIMLKKDIVGLTPQQIQIRYALPTIPTTVSYIEFPPLSFLSMGKVQYHQFEAHMPATAPSGAMQFRIEEPKERRNFSEFYSASVKKQEPLPAVFH